MKYLALFAFFFFASIPVAFADCPEGQVENLGTGTCENAQQETTSATPTDTSSVSCPSGQVESTDGTCVDANGKTTTATPTAATPGATQQVSNGASAQNGKFVALAPIPGLTDIQPTEGGLAAFFNNLYKYLVGLAATLAVIMIIWGGLEYATQDIPGQKQQGKERIQQALLGLVLVLAPVLVFSIINPSILNLSINLPELDTQSGKVAPGTSGSGTPSGASTDPKTGCVTKGSLLTQASCPSKKSAEDFVASCGGRGKLMGCDTENAQRECTAQKAVCEPADSGPFMFIDVSSAYIPSIVTPLLFSSYELLVSSATNPNNGAEAMAFAAKCTQDGGMTCIEVTVNRVPCTHTTDQPSSQNNKCYSNQISCKIGMDKANCKSGPAWKPIK